jgi:hypothetical protein
MRPELDRYLEESLVSRLGKESHRRVPKYWKSHQFDYPILSQMARDFLDQTRIIRSICFPCSTIWTQYVEYR